MASNSSQSASKPFDDTVFQIVECGIACGSGRLGTVASPWGGAVDRRAGDDRYAFLRPAAEFPKKRNASAPTFEPDRRIAEGQIVELVEHPPVSKEARKVCSAQAPGRLPTCARAISFPIVI